MGDARQQLALAEGLQDKRAMSVEEISKRRWAVLANEAKLAQARAQLALIKAGAWKPDLDVAKAQVAAAEAQVRQTETDIERLTVRALVSGQVLQVNIRLGNLPRPACSPPRCYCSAMWSRCTCGWTSTKMMPGGCVLKRRRWRSCGGNRALETPIHFARFEPYVVPKRSLTGDTTERVDTRVLQVLYQFHPGDLPGVCRPADGCVH